MIRSLPLPVLKRPLSPCSIIPARAKLETNFTQAAFKKSTFTLVGRQRKRALVTFRRFHLRSDPAQQIGPRCMQQVILVEIAGRGERLNERQPPSRTVGHRDRYRAVQ